MKKVSNSTGMEEVVFSYHEAPGKIAFGKTKKEFENREIPITYANKSVVALIGR